jgi:hypothetical protein
VTPTADAEARGASALERGPLNAQGCLFCLRSDGGFSSCEHVFSEGLGNHEKVLPPGVTCDRCNHGPLALADQALVSFEGVAFLKAERGIPSKAGKPAVVKFGNATIFWSGPGNLEVVRPNRKAIEHMHKAEPGGGSHGKLHLHSGGPITAQRIGRIVRSVWKSAIECIYLIHGPTVAFDPQLDSARAAVIDQDAHGWALVPKTATPCDDIKLHYSFPVTRHGRFALPVRMSVFGVEFYTDPVLRDIGDNYYDFPFPVNMWEF